MRGAEAAMASSGRSTTAAAASTRSSSCALLPPRCCFFGSRTPPSERRSSLRATSSAAAERVAGFLGGETVPRGSPAALSASQVRCRRRRRNRAAAVAAAAVAATGDEDSEAATTSTSTSDTAPTSSPRCAFAALQARPCSSRLVAASLAFLSALSHAPEALAATAAAGAAGATAAAGAATAAAAAAAAAAAVTSSSAAVAAVGSVAEGGGGPLPPALLEALSSFLAAVEDMGPAGAGVFAATVALAELVPLLPTTPLALASGLLFGAAKGALLVIAGNLTAATVAFYISRGIGARFAKRMVAAEGGHQHHAGQEGQEVEENGSKATSSSSSSSSAAAASNGGGGGGGLAARFAAVTAAIEAGTPAQKFAAVFALRATPVVPFSASNYVLGLSPVSFPVYITATALGGSVWASVYASLGAASRALLARGAAIDVLVADLLEQATSVADDAATGLVLLSVGAAAGWGLALAAKAARSGDNDKEAEEEGSEGKGGRSAAQGDGKAQASDPKLPATGEGSDGGGERPLEALRE